MTEGEGYLTRSRAARVTVDMEEETYPSFRSETVNYDLATPVTDNMEWIKEYIKHQDQVSIRRMEEAETRDKLLIRMLGERKDIDERVRIRIAEKTEALKGLQKWEDGCEPETYLKIFEDTMREAEIPEAEWIKRLKKLMVGKALTVYGDMLPPPEMTYWQLTEGMRQRLGATAADARKKLWLNRTKPEDHPRDFIKTLASATARLKKGFTTIDEAADEILKGALMLHYSNEVMHHIKQSKPDNHYHIGEAVQELWEARGWQGKRRMLRQTWDRPTQQYQQQQQTMGPISKGDDNHPRKRSEGESLSTGGGAGHSHQRGGFRVSHTPGQGPGPSKGQGRPRQQVTCFGCGKQGHYKNECPEESAKVSRIASPSPEISIYKKKGQVNGLNCNMRLDTGADITAVPGNLVRPNQLTGEHTDIKSIGSESQVFPLAKVPIELEGVKRKVTVIVLPEGADEVLIGANFPTLHEMIVECQGKVEGNEKGMIGAITRARSQEIARENSEKKAADKRDEAVALTLNETPEVNRPKRRRKYKFAKGEPQVQESQANESPSQAPVVENNQEEGEGKSDRDEAERVEAEVEEEISDKIMPEAEGIVLQGECEEGSAPPLPILTESKEEIASLIAQQLADESLKHMMSWAKEKEKGFDVVDGVLVSVMFRDPGIECVRVVVPKVRRKEILDVAHRGLVGGHFSHNRMVATMRNVFTWPGMNRDTRDYCRACVECQKAGRAAQPKAPLIPMRVISVPYERLAVDIVGPLTRTRSGYKYLLTVLCMGTRYPYAIPLKRVDAVTVAEALVEVIAHTGIPKEILSDQGSVFVGRLNQEMSKLLGIDRLKTSPYHPQTNGAIERWHSCLKGMLRKMDDRKTDWDRLIKYCLLAYRATPHAATGFSPFEMIHGRNLRGPLEVMKEGWLSGEVNFVSSIEWVNELRENLANVHEVMKEREKEDKRKMEERYDIRAVERTFEIGQMVLVHTPEMAGKLDTVWEGPYEIIKIISPTTYRLSVPDRRCHEMIVHVNRLKEWKIPKLGMYRVVVADEVEGDDESIGKIKMGESKLSEEHREELREVLERYKDVITERLGNVRGIEHEIRTVGYYRRFVPEFGGRAQPLNHALRKEAPEVIDWDVGKLQSIEYLKTILCSNNILWLPRGDDFFILHTDASRQGIGAVLSTVRDREERPLGYFSRKLTTAESNYTVSELECLAVVRAVDAFAIHLHGRKFRIVTDHRALTALNTSSKLNGRLLRWALALQAYFFDVQHRAGVNHNNADGLSRQAWQEVDSIPDKDSKAEIKRDRLSPREGGCQGPTS